MTGKLFTFANVRLAYDRQHVHFDYQVTTDEQTFDFTETIRLPKSLPANGTVDRILRAMHIAIGISYYKIFIPPELDYGYSMSSDEAEFWNIVYKNGLGEFLFKNQISSEKLAKFVSQEGPINPDDTDDIKWEYNSALLGIGGGKDSIVAGELLIDASIKTTGFVLATKDNTGQAIAVANKMGVKIDVIERTIDKKILEINKLPGALNGHVPISLIFALCGCLLSTIDKQKYVIVANESSASIPHAKWENQNINHQWSKSLEFEKLFQQFVHDNISENLDYTSAVRPLSSIAIAKIFSKYPIYFETFTSDNSLFKIEKEEREHPRWSHNSPKTLSSFILLAPWISDEDLITIFGKNYLYEKDLEQLFLSLLGIEGDPVLDCVGTPDELKITIQLLNDQNRYQDSPFMQIAKSKNLFSNENFKDKIKDSLTISKDHSLPDELGNVLMKIMREKLK